MKICTFILRVCLRKWKDCNDGITDGWNLQSATLTWLRCDDIPSFIKTGSGIQKLMGGMRIQTDTDTMVIS
jgi:hypothetical protein